MPILLIMKARILIVLLLLFTSGSVFAGTWIEDSLGFAFEFPRGWSKAVLRNSETVRIQFAKASREAVLQIDVVRRTKDYDLDRFIEETVDTFLAKYPDLKVVREKMLNEETPGYDESVFIVLHYQENKVLVSNRFLFHKKGNMYYVVQAKVVRKRYAYYAKDLDLIMKTFRMEPRVKSRWRNDSLAYLDPERDQKAIQYISITIRPIETYPTTADQKNSDTWLNSVDGFKNPFSADSDVPPEEVAPDNMISPSAEGKPIKDTKDEPTTVPGNPTMPPETGPL